MQDTSGNIPLRPHFESFQVAILIYQLSQNNISIISDN